MLEKIKANDDAFLSILFLVGCAIFILPAIVFAKEIYVSPIGSEGNTGTSIDSPWALQYAADRTNPGDIVYLTSGTYSEPNENENILSIIKGGDKVGDEEIYVTYRPALGHTPKIKGGGPGMWSAIFVDASYVRIEGLEVIGDNANLDLSGAEAAYEAHEAGGRDWQTYAKYNIEGICIGESNGSSPHHIEVVGCTIHDFAGGGIQVTKSDYVTIKNNIIYNNAWYTMYAESGISIFHSFNLDDNTSTYRMVVSGNEVYNNYTQIPWEYNDQFSDGNGIIIDDNRNTQSSNTNNDIPYTGKILVENNLSYDNGGGGVNVFKSDNVDVVNNTTHGNGKKVGYPEIAFTMAVNGRSFNNITYAKDGIKAFANEGSITITSDYNIYYGETTVGLGPNDIKDDPEFTRRDGNDFTPKSSSPAIDTGGGALKSTHDITGKTRPQGKGHDRGAYEQIAGTMPPSPPKRRHID